MQTRRPQGTGTLTERPKGFDHWHYRFTLGVDPITGKQVRKSYTFYVKGKRSAEAEVVRIRRELADIVQAPRASMADLLDTIPQATKKILNDAANLKFKPQFVISGVGSDPQTVANKNEIGALSMTFFPATSDTKNSWNKWIAKVLAADKTDLPKFKTSTILTGNMQNGAGWAVTFLQLVKAMGSTVTQANAVNTLETSGSSFVTPAITQLAYSASNHQGLMGGMMVTVKSVTATTPVKNAKVYTTTDADGSPLVAKTPTNTSVQPGSNSSSELQSLKNPRRATGGGYSRK